MKTAPLPRPLRGIIPPLATPLRDRDELDHVGLERLVEHTLKGGVHGLFILGTTGEGPGLSHRVRYELIERTCEIVAGRVPVLVGITDTSFVESLETAEQAVDSGASAVVVAPPYYFIPGQPELIEYVERLAAEVPLPLFLYNIPSHAHVGVELDTVQRAIDFPNVVGIKDSAGHMGFFHKVLKIAAARPDFSVLIGPEEMMAEAVLLGAHGGVCGGSNLAPELYVGLYEAAVRGDLAKVRELHARVIDISATIYSVGRHGSAYLKGLKCALACLGLCDDFMAEPFRRFEGAERERIEQHVRRLGLLREASAVP